MNLEDWKYSNINKIKSYLLDANSVQFDLANIQDQLTKLSHCTDLIVFIDGQLKEGLSKFRNVKLNIGKNDEYNEDDFILKFNALKSKNKSTVSIEGNANPITLNIIHILSSGSSANQLEVIVGQKSSIEFNEVFISPQNMSVFHSCITNIIQNQDSEVCYNVISFLSSQERLSHVLNIRQEERASSKVFNASAGGEWCRFDLNIFLKSVEANTKAGGLYLRGGSEIVDHCTKIFHQSPKTESEQLYKGILAGTAKGIFNGMIRIDAGCPEAKTSQLNKNLIIGNRAEAISRPQLEIHTDNVKANHGMTIGSLNPNEFFYLQSRGLNSDQANKILSEAFINELVDVYANKSLAEYLKTKIQDHWSSLKGSVI